MGICGQTVGGVDDGNLKLFGMRLWGTGRSIRAFSQPTIPRTLVRRNKVSRLPVGTLWPNRICWIKWEVVGRYEIFSWSHDGVNWVAMDSTRAIGAYNYPTKWGVFIGSDKQCDAGILDPDSLGRDLNDGGKLAS